MKASELRIRNIVVFSDDQTQFTVGEIHETGLVVQNQDETTWIELVEFEPIPLTEEWLLRFGFYRVENGYFGSMPYNKPCWNKFSFTILVWDDGSLAYDWNGGNTMLKYVHQLQNLYFALTGEELKVNNPQTSER